MGSVFCYDCGECIVVCFVGVLSYKDFVYMVNVWELKKIYFICLYCLVGCLIFYDVCYFDILGEEFKIFRVFNDFYYNFICGVGCFVFDVSFSFKGSVNFKEV